MRKLIEKYEKELEKLSPNERNYEELVGLSDEDFYSQGEINGTIKKIREIITDLVNLEREELVSEIKAENFRLEQDKLGWKEILKDLINVDSLFKALKEDFSDWQPLGIVEIYDTEEKTSGYSSYQHVRIKDDKYKLLYMKQSEDEIEGIDHCCVWQTCGCCEDDYSGFLLFPLKDGKYFKISYSC